MVANPVKGEAPLVLTDGREFTLVADHAGLVKAAQAYSGSTKLQKLMSDMQPEVDAKGQLVLDEDGDPVKDTMPATAAFLFGLFDAYHPDVTQRDALNILLAEQEVVTEAISQAVASGFPDMVKGKPGNEPAPKAKSPRGKTSGRSGAKSG